MKIAIIAAWIIATAALAGPQAVWKDGTTRTYWPSRIAWPDGRETLGANASQCAEAGVARHETKQEQDKREQAAAAAAQAEAEAQATMPQMSVTGYAAPNEAGHWVKFVPVGTNAVTEMLGIQISHSPPDPETAALLEADGLAAYSARKAAKKAKRDSARGKAGKANSVPALREAFAELLDSLED